LKFIRLAFVKRLNIDRFEGYISITVLLRTLTTDIGRCGDDVKNNSKLKGA